ncbi:MAG: transglycosylase SLT domain-containing protein, partial [Termitinemataceae bacterium]
MKALAPPGTPLSSIIDEKSPYLLKARITALIPLLLEAKREQEAITILSTIFSLKTYRSETWVRVLLAKSLYSAKQYERLLDLYAKSEPTSTTEVGLYILAGLHINPGNTKLVQYLERFFLEGAFTEEHQDFFKKSTTIPGFSIPEPINSAIRGRMFILDRSYKDALYFFKLVWQKHRQLFEIYPELLTDFGKAYQYSGTTNTTEGLSLFADWEKSLGHGASARANDNRFRVLFYAGRMARQVEQLQEALSYFNRALALAPDSRQRDACLWYLLDTAFTISHEEFVRILESTITVWNNPAYFDDILDKICTTYTTKHNWKALFEVFRRIYRQADRPVIARYAYILGRAFQEGYFPRETSLDFAGIPVGASNQEKARALFNVAFESDQASYYYRSLSAAFLGTSVTVLPGPSDTPPNLVVQVQRDSLFEFLQGFFKFNTADIALPYIREYESQLTADEIRSLAKSFAHAGRWGDSIRLSSTALLGTSNLTLVRSDFELLYPRAFSELIENSARTHKIPVEIFYGLIRTESAFIYDAVSRSGAIGLTQLMEPTAQDAAARIKRAGGPDFTKSGTNLTDPATNLYIGAWYLSWLIERTGSPLLALASYNGGITRVRTWRNSQ